MQESHRTPTDIHTPQPPRPEDLDTQFADDLSHIEELPVLKARLQSKLGSSAVYSPHDASGVGSVIGIEEYDWEPKEAVSGDVDYDRPDPAAVAEMERYGYVRQAPRFLEQLHDSGRTNLIKYVYGQQKALGTQTGEGKTVSLSEHESINELYDFLDDVIDDLGEDSHEGRVAASMQDRLTFIGRKEYLEATAGIALSWKQKLDTDPRAQICAVTGRIAGNAIKSDAYMLDTIISHFSDEELAGYRGRLLTDPDDLRGRPRDVEVVMLDDWTISGEQMSEAALTFSIEHPAYSDRLAIQLLAATDDRIQNGLEATLKMHKGGRSAGFQMTHIPVQAYFRAHDAYAGMAEKSGAHITGAHCAVDYDFNTKIEALAHLTGMEMPPATNIVRPYRDKKLVLRQLERLDRYDGPDDRV